MSDQVHLLTHGIPGIIAGVFVVFLIIGITGSVWGIRRGLDGGENILRITAGILAAIGLVIAGYVVWTAVIQGEIPQCVGGGGGCGAVEHSKYSHIAGIHVSIFGLIGYGAILLATLWKGDYARLAAFFLALFGFGFSLYLTYLELWEILAVCQWCVSSAVAMTMLFVVNTCRLLVFYGTDDPDGSFGPVDEAEPDPVA
jgi:uncharacterized membrane protein